MIQASLTLLVMSFPAKTSREAILKAATEIVGLAGWDSLSMRVLANHLGVQASSLYHHFPDRQSIEAALGQHTSLELSARLEQASDIQTVAKLYLEFAQANAAFYHLVEEASEPMWRSLMQHSKFAGIQQQAAAMAMWSYLHGYVTLYAKGQLGATADHSSFELGWSALVAGLKVKKNIL
jgi:AcrR family transcriptional regulator